MRIIGLFALLLFTFGGAIAAPAAAPPANPLLGTWRLVAAIPGDMQDSSPNGVRNLRLRFGADGEATMVDPTEILSESVSRNEYSIDGNTLTLKLKAGDREVLHGAIESLPDGTVSVTFLESGMTWSLRPLADNLIESQRLAPESLQYLPPTTLAKIDAFKYDEADYSKLPAVERLLGQWEVVEISGYGGGDFPPYGAPNDVWQFQGKQIRRFDRTKEDDEPLFMEYEVRGPYLLLGGVEGGQPTPFTFDEWQRLVIGDPDRQHTVLKRINRDGKGKMKVPPLRIILGYPGGNG